MPSCPTQDTVEHKPSLAPTPGLCWARRVTAACRPLPAGLTAAWPHRRKVGCWEPLLGRQGGSRWDCAGLGRQAPGVCPLVLHTEHTCQRWSHGIKNVKRGPHSIKPQAWALLSVRTWDTGCVSLKLVLPPRNFLWPVPLNQTSCHFLCTLPTPCLHGPLHLAHCVPLSTFMSVSQNIL